LKPIGILEQVELVRLRLHLEFDEDCLLPPGFALQLRRELLHAGRMVLNREAFRQLFEPSLPDDSLALRLFQRPAPAFILKAGTTAEKWVHAGDAWQMEFLFIGRGISYIADFIRVIQQLGQVGIARGQGRFVLVAASTVGAAGDVAEFCQSVRGTSLESPQLLPLAWLVDTTSRAASWRIDLATPARLVSHGKPLFRPDFVALFPFILRRVGAMLCHWGGINFELDPQPLMAAAASVKVVDNRLYWEDWKSLQRSAGMEALGGISGSLTFAGTEIDDILWVLSLGALLHIGKGAAYGSGEYRLTAQGNCESAVAR